MLATPRKALSTALVFTASLLLLFTPQALAVEATPPITIYYMERAPYFYTAEDGRPRGLLIERVQLVFEKAGVPHRFELLPTKRHMAYLQERSGQFCTIGWYRNAEREKFAKYSAPIYQNKTRIGLARADNERIRSGMEIDAVFADRELTLLVRDGYSYGAYIDKKIRALRPVIQVLPFENTHMLKMIHNRRGDYLFTSEEEAAAMIANEGFARADFKYVRFAAMPSGLKRYILYDQSVSDDLIERVDRAIERHLP